MKQFQLRALPLALLCASLSVIIPANAGSSPPNYKVCPIGHGCKWVPMPAKAVGRVTSIIPDNAIPGVTSSWIGKSMTPRGERHHRCYNAVDWRGQSKSVCTMIHYTRGLAGYTIETKKADDGTLLTCSGGLPTASLAPTRMKCATSDSICTG